MLVAHLAWRQSTPQHVLVHRLEVIKSNFSGVKRKIRDEVLVLYLYLVSGRGRMDMSN